MCLTSAQYAEIIGETAPEDFEVCLRLARSMLDARTLCFYASRDMAALPGLIQRTLQHYCAYQTQALSQAGGVAAALDAPVQSASLGQFSFTAGVGAGAFCPAAATLLPILVSYAKCD